MVKRSAHSRSRMSEKPVISKISMMVSLAFFTTMPPCLFITFRALKMTRSPAEDRYSKAARSRVRLVTPSRPFFSSASSWGGRSGVQPAFQSHCEGRAAPRFTDLHRFLLLYVLFMPFTLQGPVSIKEERRTIEGFYCPARQMIAEILTDFKIFDTKTTIILAQISEPVKGSRQPPR